MAMKPCKECGKEVSSQAKTCPHCGVEIVKTSKSISTCSGCLIVLLAVAVFGWIGGLLTDCGSKSGNEPNDHAIAEAHKGEKIIGMVLAKDSVNIRTGPGTNYPKDKSGALAYGEKLHLLEHKSIYTDRIEDWLRFRVTEEDVGWSGWVRKDLTMSVAEWNSIQKKRRDKNMAQNIKVLLDNGLLKKFDVELGEYYVEPRLWHRFPFETKRNVAATLGAHRDALDGHGNVRIMDYYSGKKIADYSFMGLNVYD